MRCATACGRVGRARKWLGELDIAFNQRGGGGGGEDEGAREGIMAYNSFLSTCTPLRPALSCEWASR